MSFNGNQSEKKLRGQDEPDLHTLFLASKNNHLTLNCERGRRSKRTPVTRLGMFFTFASSHNFPSNLFTSSLVNHSLTRKRDK